MAVIATFFYPGVENFALIAIAILVGTVLAGYTAKKVDMTEMPEMIALYNGMGGGAAAAIAAVELFKDHDLSISVTTLALIGGVIGSISFTGSLIAFGKLQGMIKGTFRFKGQHQIQPPFTCWICDLISTYHCWLRHKFKLGNCGFCYRTNFGCRNDNANRWWRYGGSDFTL